MSRSRVVSFGSRSVSSSTLRRAGCRLWQRAVTGRFAGTVPTLSSTSGPPHFTHHIGYHLHRWTGLPWLADFRDPWVAGDQSPVTWKVSSRSAGDELRVMREANAIILNAPNACNLLRQAYPEHAAKMTTITNGYDPESFELNPIPPLSGPTIEVVHTGVVYANRSPQPFLEAIRLLDSATLAGRNLRLRFIGQFLSEEQRREIEDKIRGGVERFCMPGRARAVHGSHPRDGQGGRPAPPGQPGATSGRSGQTLRVHRCPTADPGPRRAAERRGLGLAREWASPSGRAAA